MFYVLDLLISDDTQFFKVIGVENSKSIRKVNQFHTSFVHGTTCREIY